MLKIGNSKDLSFLSDPFKSDCVVSINFYYTKKVFKDEFTWKSRVKFQNKDTEGIQNFEEEDFEVIVKKVQTFINSLDNK